MLKVIFSKVFLLSRRFSLSVRFAYRLGCIARDVSEHRGKIFKVSFFHFPYFLEEKNTIFGSAPSAENYPFTPSEKTAKQIFPPSTWGRRRNGKANSATNLKFTREMGLEAWCVGDVALRFGAAVTKAIFDGESEESKTARSWCRTRTPKPCMGEDSKNQLSKE
jgi:hypothetical protein